MAAMVRAAALRGFVPLVDNLGGDGTALLDRFHISGESIATDDAVIASTTIGRVLETAATAVSCPDFGLRLARRQDVSILGPLAVAIGNAPTLGAAMECASRFLYVHSAALSVTRLPDPEGQAGVVGLLYRSTEPEAPLSNQATDLGVGLLHRIIVLLHGGSYGLRSAHLPHPMLAPVSHYTEFFGADVRFGQDDAVLRLPTGLVDAPLHGTDEMVRTMAVDYLSSHFGEPAQTLRSQVHGALRRSLGTTPARIESVAQVLRTHPRTLQRHLAAEGTTFELVLDDVRREAAHRLLTETDMPLSQVAALTGFSEQSALSRAARRWFGRTPTRIRRDAANGPDGS